MKPTPKKPKARPSPLLSVKTPGARAVLGALLKVGEQLVRPTSEIAPGGKLIAALARLVEQGVVQVTHTRKTGESQIIRVK